MTAPIKIATASFLLILALGSVLVWNGQPARGQQPAAPAPARPPHSRARVPGPESRIMCGPRPTCLNDAEVSSIIIPTPIPGTTTTMRRPAFAIRAASANTRSIILRETSFRSREIPCGLPSSVLAAIPVAAEQMEAQRIGISRYNSIQNHIDNYARPTFGFGFGVGGFGGFW